MLRKLMAASLVALMVGASSGSLAVDRFGARTLEGTAANVNGVWSLDFCWEGSSCSQTSWTFRQAAIFFGLDAGDAPESIDAVGISLNGLLIAQYLAGCKPTYRSLNATESSMSGKMACSDGSGGTGTWEATRSVMGDLMPNNNSGITSDGSAD